MHPGHALWTTFPPFSRAESHSLHGHHTQIAGSSLSRGWSLLIGFSSRARLHRSTFIFVTIMSFHLLRPLYIVYAAFSLLDAILSPSRYFLAPTSRLTQFSSHEWISASRLSAYSLQQTSPLVVANIITRSERLIEDKKKEEKIDHGYLTSHEP